jgi:hypothetical protein
LESYLKLKCINSWRIAISKTLIVNNIPFEYPDSGDEPGWGNSATGWAEEVTEVLQNVVGPNDILETSFNIANNQVAVANITGLIFNAGSVRSARVEYSIYRISDSNPSGQTEGGEIRLAYDNNVGWSFVIGGLTGNSGVVFSLTPAGQFQYTSTDIGSINYIGVIKFSALALEQ